MADIFFSGGTLNAKEGFRKLYDQIHVDAARRNRTDGSCKLYFGTGHGYYQRSHR